MNHNYSTFIHWAEREAELIELALTIWFDDVLIKRWDAKWFILLQTEHFFFSPRFR